MPSTHLSLHYHIVFSTKERRRLIADPWRDELHAYLGGILKKMDAIPEAIGGPGDHAHLLMGLRATHALAEVVRQIKRGSSEWIHSHGVRKFAWQEGYGAWTVSPSQIPKVKKYIANQVEHHRQRTFEEEYLTLLKLSGIEYDERYLW
jgi:REP element-mobilizing transposase RayT